MSVKTKLLFIARKSYPDAFIYQALEKELSYNGFDLTMICDAKAAMQNEYKDYLKQKHFQGFIIFQEWPLSLASEKLLLSQEKPVYFINYGRYSSFDSFCLDPAPAFKTIADKLSDKHYQSTVYLHNGSITPYCPIFKQRMQLFREVFGQVPGIRPILISWQKKGKEGAYTEAEIIDRILASQRTNPSSINKVLIVMEAIGLTEKLISHLFAEYKDIAPYLEFVAFSTGVASSNFLHEHPKKNQLIGVIDENWEELGINCAQHIVSHFYQRKNHGSICEIKSQYRSMKENLN